MIVSQSISFYGNNHVNIPMIYTKPSVEHDTCIVMLHGTCSNKNEVNNMYVYMSKYFANHRIASIRFDFIGNGDSEEDYIRYNLKSAIQDTKDVVYYAHLLGYKNIYLLGLSQGASIALLAADDSIQGVITLSVALNLKEFAKPEHVEIAKEKGYILYDPGYRKPVKLSKEWFEDVLTTDIQEIYSKKNLPTLAIHGTNDDVVHSSQSKILIEQAKHPKSKLIYMNDCNHIYNCLTQEYTYIKIICEEILTWCIS